MYITIRYRESITPFELDLLVEYGTREGYRRPHMSDRDVARLVLIYEGIFIIDKLESDRAEQVRDNLKDT